MEKISAQRIRCVIMGCSRVAEEDSDPPMCSAHMREKTASKGTSFGIKAITETADELWREDDADVSK